MIIYTVLVIMGIFTLWSIIYTWNVKKKGINKLVDNIIEYDKKKKAKQQKS